jgi:mitogen-activated protein kinase kinase kinase
MLQHWPQGLQIGTLTSITGANILVDNKGCIKLADFGASKKVVQLATISEAKSMKGTPY